MEDVKSLQEGLATAVQALNDFKSEKNRSESEIASFAENVNAQFEKTDVQLKKIEDALEAKKAEKVIVDSLFDAKSQNLNLKEVEAQVIADYVKELDSKLRHKNHLINAEVFEKAANLYAEKSVINGNKEDIQKMKQNLLDASNSIGSMPVLDFKTLREGVNPDGGYVALPAQIGAVQSREFASLAFRNSANVINISAESIDFPIDDGLFAILNPGEEGTRTATATSSFGKVSIKAGEYFAEPVITTKMLEDSAIDIVSWINRKTEEAFSLAQEEDFMIGDGNNDKPKGIFAYDTWTTTRIYERGKLEAETIATNFTNLADMIIDAFETLPTRAQTNAKYLTSPLLWRTILRMKDSSTDYLLSPAMIATGYGRTLYGRPVIISDYVPAMASITNGTATLVASKKGLACGDFSSYVIADRLGTKRLEDPYTSAGYVKYRSSKRTGGGLNRFQDIKLIKS